MDSTDSVVMGGQKKRDTLAEMPRFGGRNVQDGEVFPVWLKELTKKVKFDVGDIGVRIIKGEVRRGDIKTGDRAGEETEGPLASGGVSVSSLHPHCCTATPPAAGGALGYGSARIFYSVYAVVD